MINNEVIKRFMLLFRGNDRTFGTFDPKAKRKDRQQSTEHAAVTIDDFKEHLTGARGVGMVPIMDDGMCYFGAIDIDAHGDAPDIDIISLEKQVRENDIPLTVCRSKSGGAHLYLFGAEPLKAALVRSALSKWAEILGHAGCEIFPKQSKLIKDEDGQIQNGNYINLCYFDSENPNQLRYSIEGGHPISLAYFLDLAESRKITGSMLVERSDTDHNGAPPCIQRMITGGVPGGHRNIALYNLCIYLKQAYPETWRDKAFDLNAKVFDKPLEHAEAKKAIQSVARREYRYKCGEEPCKSRCNSAICVTRKFGITEDEKNEMEIGKPPEFNHLRKVLTDPVRWILAVDGKDITISTTELMDFRRVRERIAEKLTRLVPPMKNDRWLVTLHPLMEVATMIEAPDEASTSGLVRAKLSEFIAKTDLNNDGKSIDDRKALYMGSPVVQEKDGGRVVYFRATDFVGFLKKSRSEELKGSNLWMALREAGVQHQKLRAGAGSIQVWFVPITEDATLDIDAMEVKNEF
jgi:hypothetical protein